MRAAIAIAMHQSSGKPMQRYGKTDEIAAVIAFLASDGAGYITRQNLRVDGGITRSVKRPRAAVSP